MPVPRKVIQGLMRYRFFPARRITQGAVMFFFIAGNVYGWNILKGNLRAARLFDALPLTDPFALLQMAAARALSFKIRPFRTKPTKEEKYA